MKRIRVFERAAKWVLPILLFVCFWGAATSSAEVKIISADAWPMWPEPTIQINDLSIEEPATFLSIGREIVPWPYFGETTTSGEYLNIVGGDLNFVIEEKVLSNDELLTIFHFKNAVEETPENDLYFVMGNTTSKIGDTGLGNNDILEGDISFGEDAGLRGLSVIPEYVSDWIVSTDQYGNIAEELADNESLLKNGDDSDSNDYDYLNDWKSFLTKDQNVGTEELFFADSGHAPPHMVWPFDPWLYQYRAVTGYEKDLFTSWPEDRYLCLWPTNQGALQAFEIYNVYKDTPRDITSGTNVPYVKRTWLTVPNPAFRQSIYHQLHKAFSNYKRLTVLDGPVTVRDVELGDTKENWRRIAVGTTGIGTKQLPKPHNAWKKLNQIGTEYNNYPLETDEPTTSNGLGNGRAFGVYAFDISELPTKESASELDALWSVSNVYYVTSSKSFHEFHVENKNEAETFQGTASGVTTQEGLDYGAYADLKFSVSKPLIGYTKNGDNREWHVVILGVDQQNRYKWLDLDPANGSVKDFGYFVNEASNEKETLEDASFVSLGELSGEEVERLFPSRILSAFPPDDYEYREPLLSDIYVHLSNGAFYRWNLNDGDAPEWLVTFKSERADEIAPPLTDFDITYTESGDTFLATNVYLKNVPNDKAKHDTEGLLIANLTKLAEKTVSERETIRVPPGKEGTTFSSDDQLLGFIQTELAHGAYDPESKTVLASPVFIANRLYLAFYEFSRKGKSNNTTEISRLYSILFGRMMGSDYKLESAEVVTGEDGEPTIVGDYFDYSDQEAVMIIVDSEGNLVLFDASGQPIGDPIPTGLFFYADDGSGEDPFESEGVHTVYWKTK